jgi:hypothetical protein
MVGLGALLSGYLADHLGVRLVFIFCAGVDSEE